MNPLIYLSLKLVKNLENVVSSAWDPAILNRTPLVGTETNPNGKITGNQGQIYVDSITPRIWIKMYGTGDGNNTGWV